MGANIGHEAVIDCQPSDPSIKVWRYFNVLGLLALLQTRSLRFTRVDMFDDRLEGSLTRRNVAVREQQIRMALADIDPGTDTPEGLVNALPEMTRGAVRCAYANCWHASETESQAMWKLYGTESGSVALQSTYGKLQDVLPSRIVYREGRPSGAAMMSAIFLGMVQYRDYGSDVDCVPSGNLLYPFLSKRKELQHERELRAFALFTEPLLLDRPDGERLADLESMPTGLDAEVDIDRLVETVRVQPGTPAWARRSVEKLIRKYGWDVDVVASDIDTSPLY